MRFSNVSACLKIKTEHKQALGAIDCQRKENDMNTQKFLVVDDSLTMRRIIRNALRSIGFENVREAANGQLAQQVMLEEGADFLVLDWNMPVMSGVELAKWVRGNNFFRNIPVLMITTKSSTDDIMVALGAEVDDYIIKPFTPQGLKEKIEKINATRVAKSA